MHKYSPTEAERRMKVAIASSGLGFIRRGMEAWAASLARELDARGGNVTLFKGRGPVTEKYEKILPTVSRNSPIAMFLALITKKGGWRVGLGAPHGIESFIFGTQLAWVIRRSYDIVHVQQESLCIFLQRLRKKGILNLPIVFANGQKASPRALREFDFIQCLTPFGLEEVLPYTKEGAKTVVIPNFVDTSLFSPGPKDDARIKLGLPSEAFVVGSVGVIDTTVKRMNYFVEEMAKVAAELPVNNLYFLIAGASHPDELKIREQAARLLKNKISIFTDLPPEFMKYVYRAMDLFALCSPREAMPMAVIEAMSCSVPVVCHDHPVMRWVVGEGGSCVDMMRPGALAGMVKKYMGNYSLRMPHGKAGRDRAVKDFSAETVVTEIIKFYSQIVKSDSIPS